MINIYSILLVFVLLACRKETTEPLANIAEKNSNIVYPNTVECEGFYSGHLQGICIDNKDKLFWSFTTKLVKTNLKGEILDTINVVSHHGDLCYNNGQLFVAVNLGVFNESSGANSWIFVYDTSTLQEKARYPLPEVIYGAGGVAFHNNKFIVVGGLTTSLKENYLYEYSVNFQFIQRHTLNSGNTYQGIQTAEYADGYWWFGCYGNPPILLRANDNFQLTDKTIFDASLGIASLPYKRKLIGANVLVTNLGNKGRANLYDDGSIIK